MQRFIMINAIMVCILLIILKNVEILINLQETDPLICTYKEPSNMKLSAAVSGFIPAGKSA